MHIIITGLREFSLLSLCLLLQPPTIRKHNYELSQTLGMDCVFVWEKEQILQKWEMGRQRDGRTDHATEKMKRKANAILSECIWMQWINTRDTYLLTHFSHSHTKTQTWETIFSLTFHYYHTTCCNAWILYCIMYVLIRIHYYFLSV